MKDQEIEVEFTSDLREFLQRRGYSHIISIGIEPKELNDANEPETGRENYWLEPVKSDDERLKGETPDQMIQAITDAEILDMVNGDDEVQFMVKVPVVDYNDYLQKR